MNLEPIVVLASLALASIYSYLIYPIILLVLPVRRRAESSVGTEPSSFVLIIAAHNEQDRIGDKIEESLLLRSTIPELEIIVASDSSDDETDRIVASYENRGVKLVRSSERNGKEFAQGLAISATESDIVIFSDVGTRIEGSSLAHIRRLFTDRSIGAISSEDRILTESGEPVGEGLYVRYEMWLRRIESRKIGLIGLSGSFFAARREVVQVWNTDLPSDFCVAINARVLGYRCVSSGDVVGVYRDIRQSGDESARKIRTVIRGMTAVAKNAGMLNPFVHGGFAFQLFSHKVMRWAVPWFAGAYVVAALLFSLVETAYLLALIPAALVLLPAALGMLSERLLQSRWVNAAYYLVLTNVSVARAGLAFMFGRRITTWSPSKR